MLFGNPAVLVSLSDSCQVCLFKDNRPFWDLVVQFHLNKQTNNKKRQAKTVLSWGHAVPCVCPAAGDSHFPPPEESSPWFINDPQWIVRLALLTDINAHLNALKVKLQSKDVLVTDMPAHINAFKVKMRSIVSCWVCVISLPCCLCPWRCGPEHLR